MRSTILALALLLLASAAEAGVVRLAPEFTFMGPGDKARPLKSLRGQPVVLVVTDTAKSKLFKKQLQNIQDIYQQLASKQVIVVAAIVAGDGPIPSNAPVAVANNAAGISSTYGVQKGFSIAIIGRDGNLDYQSEKVLAAERVRDVIQNSYAVQASARKGQ